jgi:hypothetical protein
LSVAAKITIYSVICAFFEQIRRTVQFVAIIV